MEDLYQLLSEEVQSQQSRLESLAWLLSGSEKVRRTNISLECYMLHCRSCSSVRLEVRQDCRCHDPCYNDIVISFHNLKFISSLIVFPLLMAASPLENYTSNIDIRPERSAAV